MIATKQPVLNFDRNNSDDFYYVENRARLKAMARKARKQQKNLNQIMSYLMTDAEVKQIQSNWGREKTQELILHLIFENQY